MKKKESSFQRVQQRMSDYSISGVDGISATRCRSSFEILTPIFSLKRANFILCKDKKQVKVLTMEANQGL